ncbi:hypothetical protein RhiirA4_431578 [Rhizophagus irregularis]|uniref:DUF8211 domain-containing protein n=1 Tax=Rhizophagus irregularis TaxID=588596 RepID=A0A2I1HQK9_9GLOM|nr:hypothetical protein RhiirA4_431578 [Rhizophagus irregularis]
MSHNRRACVTHQSQFFRAEFTKRSKNRASDNMGIANTKASHANLIYDRWKAGTKKVITSNRLGISYDSTIHARDIKSVLVYGNKHMYRKRLSNFHLKQSKYTAVQKKQAARYNRACKRVFKTKAPNPPDLYRHRLRTAQRYRFLFLNSQYVNKPVKHLTYNHGLVSDNYGFRTPHYYKIPSYVTSRADGRAIAKRRAPLFTSAPAIGQPWVSEYESHPDMFIPDKYRDIIPKYPLYTNKGEYIVPGIFLDVWVRGKFGGQNTVFRRVKNLMGLQLFGCANGALLGNYIINNNV